MQALISKVKNEKVEEIKNTQLTLKRIRTMPGVYVYRWV